MSKPKFSKPAHKEFAQCLEGLGQYGRKNLWGVFSDFLELTYLALVQPVRKLTTGEICPKLEAEYLEKIGHYKKDGADCSLFPKAFAIMVGALEAERYDFLGCVAGELELLNQWNGQFFTPRHLCDAMARMIIGDAKPDPAQRITISEPCCGAGAIAIAAATYLQTECGFQPWHYYIVAQDVDVKMSMACYIQLTLCGVPAEVRCVNSLGCQPPSHAEVTLVGAMYPHPHSHLLGATWLEPAGVRCASENAATADRAQPSKKVRAPGAQSTPAGKSIVLKRPPADPSQGSFNFDDAADAA